MHIKYNVTIDDHVALCLFHNKHSATVRRINIFWGVIFPVCYCIFFCLLGLYRREWTSPIFGIVVGGLLMLWALAGRRKRIEKATRRMLREASKEASGQDELELTETGLTVKSKYEELKVAWEALERIGFTPDYTFIFTGVAKGIVIPRASLIEGDYEGFDSMLKETFKNKLQAQQVVNISEKIIVDSEKIYKDDLGAGRHSGFGVASFIISLMTLGLYVLIFTLTFIFAGIAPESVDRESPVARVSVFLLLLGILANLIGLVLGIAGVRQKNRKRLLSILGIIFNSAILIGFMVLIAITKPVS